MTPLAKRLPRELRRNIGKYLGIFLLMCGSIALTSGFLLAAHSIGCLIDDMRDAYTIEDGRVTTSFEATKDQLKAAEDAAGDVGGVTLYKNFSIDAIIKKTAGDDGTRRTLRTYAHRAKVDIASYCEGKEPKADDEVAIDRVFATNNNLSVGDKVELEGRTYTICGIMTQPDSQALFLNNSDFTVNTITYGVAEVGDAGFAALEDAGGAPAYAYSFTFTDRDLSTADRIDAEQDMVEALTEADGALLLDGGVGKDHKDERHDHDDDVEQRHPHHGVAVYVVARVANALVGIGVDEVIHARVGVGQRLDHHRHAAGAVALIGHLFVVILIPVAHSLFDNPLDIVVRNVIGLSLGDQVAKLAVGVGVSSALSHRNGNFTADLGENIGPLGIGRFLLTFDGTPFRMSGHDKSPKSKTFNLYLFIIAKIRVQGKPPNEFFVGFLPLRRIYKRGRWTAC